MTDHAGELGESLRQWRDRVTPADVGLPRNGERRAPGLRREEVALLAGISVDYVTRLEQGRAVNPSAQVLGALARTLRLNDDERDHLFVLGAQPLPSRGQIRSHLTPGVQRILDRLEGTAIQVSDAGWNLIAWSPMWAALMGDPSGWRGRERNTLWRHFTGLPSRVVKTAEETRRFDESTAADLRSVAAAYPEDERLHRFIAELREASPRFAEVWEQRGVAVHAEANKTIEHPAVGRIDVDCDVLSTRGTDLRIIAYTVEPGSESADRLELVRVIGLQSMTTTFADVS